MSVGTLILLVLVVVVPMLLSILSVRKNKSDENSVEARIIWSWVFAICLALEAGQIPSVNDSVAWFNNQVKAFFKANAQVALQTPDPSGDPTQYVTWDLANNKVLMKPGTSLPNGWEISVTWGEPAAGGGSKSYRLDGSIKIPLGKEKEVQVFYDPDTKVHPDKRAKMPATPFPKPER